MSLFGKIAAVFSGSGARRICVVDGDRMVGGDKVGPGERFQALNKLSRFADKENLDVRVVFGGRPLREADEGADFKGVKVLYGEDDAQVRKKLNRQLGSAGRSRGLLVTGNADLESEGVRRGFATMRTSTLRKAMEAGSGEGGGNGSRETSGRRGRGRGRGRRGSDSRQRSGRGGRSSEQKGQQQPSQEGGNDSVKSLIDLVE